MEFAKKTRKYDAFILRSYISLFISMFVVIVGALFDTTDIISVKFLIFTALVSTFNLGFTIANYPRD